jgi:hypothetical protein
MALSPEDREIVESFREFIKDSVAADERYGEAAHVDAGGGASAGVRFDVTDECWLEVLVRANVPEVRVGFVTTDPAVRDGITEMLSDAGQTFTSFVGGGFDEAGLDWPNPLVNVETAGNEFSFTTPLKLDELGDLRADDIRDRVARMLEGYLIAFGATIMPDDDAEFEEGFDDE